MTTKSSEAVVLQVAELARKLQLQPCSDDIQTPLGEFAATAVASVPGADYAAVVVCAHGQLRTVAATRGYPILLDVIAQHHRTDICAPEVWEHQVVRINDLTAGQRWPQYCREIAEKTPVRSVMSFQLFADRRRMDTLTLYSERPDAFGAESLEIGLIMATHTALAWTMLRRDQQFRSALASRDIIGQAKGMIMERFNVDAVQAFELLRRLSQTSNVAVVELAHNLVNAEHPRQ